MPLVHGALGVEASAVLTYDTRLADVARTRRLEIVAPW